MIDLDELESQIIAVAIPDDVVVDIVRDCLIAELRALRAVRAAAEVVARRWGVLEQDHADHEANGRAEDALIAALAACRPAQGAGMEKLPEPLDPIVAAIDELRAEEGSAVTICCGNPEGVGPNNEAVEVCSDWTRWNIRRFGGQTLKAALDSALHEKWLANATV